ncbi:MAG: hypothetical protein LUD29_00925 [Clostridia bacterium]|nr:hypothetical protein [Clostridia bacterium]
MEDYSVEYNKIVKGKPFTEDYGKQEYQETTIKKFSILEPIEEISYSNHSNLYNNAISRPNQDE